MVVHWNLTDLAENHLLLPPICLNFSVDQLRMTCCVFEVVKNNKPVLRYMSFTFYFQGLRLYCNFFYTETGFLKVFQTLGLFSTHFWTFTKIPTDKYRAIPERKAEGLGFRGEFQLEDPDDFSSGTAFPWTWIYFGCLGIDSVWINASSESVCGRKKLHGNV